MSSGEGSSKYFDAEALDLIERTAPLPPPPTDIARRRPLVHRADPLCHALGPLNHYSESVAADYLGQLYRSVVVAMVAMGMMQPSIYEVIDVIAMRYGLVPTRWTMGV
jgi:hypothetical protein